MVHNGIEYGDMQLIAETYDIMRRALGLTAPDMAPVFARWNEGKLSSFLIEITAKALAVNDPETGQPLVDLILDAAEQKGTGRWTSESALELGTPIPVIDAAVIARSISSMKEQRIAASKVLHGPQVEGDPKPGYETSAMLDALENALYFSKISSYAQGMALLRAASHAYEYNLNLSEIARIWKGGCIIRAKLLDPIREAFSADPDLENLLLAPHITETVNANVGSSREVVRLAVALGIPVPAQCAALSYVDSYREERLPANLIQALRDFFGAHTFKRIDKPGTFHADWSTGAAIEL
jgi:6-phosphogluconate dehydrogenase